jgi:translation elongation factor EF-4
LWILRHVAHGNYPRTFRGEFNMTVITTVPNVSYFAYTKKNPETALVVNNPTDLPEPLN